MMLQTTEAIPASSVRLARPMLSRAADSIYWISRYVERAEQVARLLSVHSSLLIDVGELASSMETTLWQSVQAALRIDTVPHTDEPLPQRVMRFATFDPTAPTSLLNCITRARENARGIRERISAEMWESLNKLYWLVRGETTAKQFDEAPDEVWRQIMAGSLLFQGLTDQTIPHDQRWHFTQAAKYIERIDCTCRVIQTRVQFFNQPDSTQATPLRNTHWMAVLRSCCSVEAFRQTQITAPDPLQVTGFLLLESEFPRSVLFSVSQAHAALRAIGAELASPGAIDAQRILGRLEATLRYAQPEEIARKGIGHYVQEIQHAITEAGDDILRRHFLN